MIHFIDQETESLKALTGSRPLGLDGQVEPFNTGHLPFPAQGSKMGITTHYGCDNDLR